TRLGGVHILASVAEQSPERYLGSVLAMLADHARARSLHRLIEIDDVRVSANLPQRPVATKGTYAAADMEAWRDNFWNRRRVEQTKVDPLHRASDVDVAAAVESIAKLLTVARSAK